MYVFQLPTFSTDHFQLADFLSTLTLTLVGLRAPRSHELFALITLRVELSLIYKLYIHILPRIPFSAPANPLSNAQSPRESFLTHSDQKDDDARVGWW